MANAKTIMVQREPVDYKGKTYMNYFVNGTVRGQKVKVRLTPPDFGGNTVLDIVFNGGSEAELVMTPFKITDEKTGRVVEGNSFAARDVGPKGEVYECKLKPFRASDKNLLDMLVNGL